MTKRAASEELITLDDVHKYARIHERVCEGGSDHWRLDKKHPLNRYIDAVPFDTFFLRGKVEKFDGACLFVDGELCGTLGHPLVEKLTAMATPAPFGKGGETLHDVDVRNALQIDGARIRIDGMSLGYALKREIEKWSGIGSNDNVVLYKLHIYPKGGHFARHVDTPHGPGHIASGIFILGSPYTGGRLVIEHRYQQESVTAEDAPGTFAAWYTDCPHWIEEVTSGSRIVLQYDLINPLVRALGEEKDKEKPIVVDEIETNGDEEKGNEDEEKDDDDEDEEESEGEEPGFFSYLGLTKPPALPVVISHIIAGVKEHFDQKWNVAILLDHCYLNKGGLTVETLKGRDKVLWDAFTGAGISTELHACVLRRTGEDPDDYSVGLLDGKDFGRTVCIPGHSKNPMTIFDNPGAEHTGNQSMPPDEAYIHGVLYCRAT
jgi:hypothetical protein